MTAIHVDGLPVTITNPGRALYASGMTKAEVVAYLLEVAPVLLPGLAERPLTRKRWPNGTAGPGFFEKQAPDGMPAWVRIVEIAHRRRGGTVRYPVVERAADLAWLGQVAALELHVPQWRLDRPRAGRFVLDLDPGPPAGLADAARVALRMRATLEGLGIASVPVTSGSAGIHVYAAVPDLPDGAGASDLARQLGERAALELPGQVVLDMSRALRPGKVLVDWSQNSPAKTTIAPYSLRGGREPRVAAPRTWAEIADPALAQLDPPEVLARLRRGIEPFGALATA